MNDRSQQVGAFFANDGPLAQALPDYEMRTEQARLAERIALAIHDGTSLVAEAGTGTGKTLAYLVPALASGLKVVVSTGTKNLQEQLLEKDLPILKKAAQRDFDVVVLKGRRNYLCEAAFERLTAQKTLAGVVDTSELTVIGEWRQNTQTGDHSEVGNLADNSEIWKELTVSSDQCPAKRCPHYEACWVTRARRRAQEAELLVVNHHLYFADVSLRQRLGDSGISILPPHDLVVFDEAQDLDEIASQHFGCQVSEGQVVELRHDVLRAVSSDAALRTRVGIALEALDREYADLFSQLPYGRGRTTLIAQAMGPKVLSSYQEIQQILQELIAALGQSEDGELPLLRRRMARMSGELAFVLHQPEAPSLEEEAVRLTDGPWDAQVDQQKDHFDELPSVRYTERLGRHRSIVARPIEVAPILERIFAKQPAICVSATLSIGDDFTFFKERVGLHRAAHFGASSPFDYESQARLYVPEDIVTPEHAAFSQQCADLSAQLIDSSGGGAFVLCTSHRMLEELSRGLRQRTKHPVYCQGDAPRTHLVEQFRMHGNAVLVATMSFWRGVDVPGQALRLVLIDRLPFASPADPIIAARLEHLRASGASPFRDYQLPQAALLLRQGFGRLIRHRNDRGLVAIMDRRIIDKSYGKTIIRSLPACPLLRKRADARLCLEAWRPLAVNVA
ncbi:MAG: ATP-dependent DNA helicase [Myxococcota bacterium]